MLQVDPSHPRLTDEVLDWAEQAAPGALSVEVAETELHLAATLERRGTPTDIPAAEHPHSFLELTDTCYCFSPTQSVVRRADRRPDRPITG
ncbi:hypothetical protein QFZ66_000327 [Streptomyces sp. B4I13]|nr:hypothetical protein [Streptomyces sp. B4I13]